MWVGCRSAKGGTVGELVYNGTHIADFDDRLLAHLESVIGAKLRRGESFQLSWRENTIGYRWLSVWLHPGLSLVYRYTGSRRPAINPAWLDALGRTANDDLGLKVVAEPAEDGA